VTTAAPREQSIDTGSALHALEQLGTPADRRHVGTAAYRLLTGYHPTEVSLDDDLSFDRHVLASILAVAAMEEGAMAARAGLAAADLVSLMTQWFPVAGGSGIACFAQDEDADDDEVAMVRDLLLAHRSSEGDLGRWLAAMIARRAIEPNHLWEDLGLRDRSELTRLLSRHFGPIAARNTQNMRWKRFFYRALCESDGFVMCTTPVCTECRDFDLCFGEESGESRMADRRREAALHATLSAISTSSSRSSE
jgi:nitrogen fixation protein NifQ